jgi:hypothetical protein
MMPRRSIKRLLLTALTLLSAFFILGRAPSESMAQTQMQEFAAPVCDPDSQRRGLPAGFEIDGDVLCGTFGGTVDWVQQNGCSGVIAPSNGSCAPTGFFPLSTFFVDPNWAIGFDPTIFRGLSNKNNDDISSAQGWNWTGGNGYPQKNDITEVYAARAAILDPDTGELNQWLFMAASTRASEGSEHIDFEWNSFGFTKTGADDGLILGGGPNAGRVAGRDFIISIDFFNGGVRPVPTIRIWNGQEFCESGDALCASLSPNPFPTAPEWFAATNCDAIQTLCPVTDPDGNPATQYTARQFVEFAVNLTSIGIEDLGDPFAPHIIVKTRSSASFTAELKDFALVAFVPPCPELLCPDIDVSPPSPITLGQSVTFTAAAPPPDGYSYSWSCSGDTTISTTVTPTATGTFDCTLRIIPRAGNTCPGIDCPVSVEVCPTPLLCEDFPISPSREIVLNIGQSVRMCAPSPPPGITYSWTALNGAPAVTQSDSICNTVGPFNMTGTFRYVLTITRAAVGPCPASAITCTVTVIVTCPELSRPACPTFTATPPAKINLGESVRACFTPASGNNRRYRWEAFQNGVNVPIAEPESTCVTVTPTRVGDDIFLLRLKVMIASDTACFRYCPFTIDVNCPLTCPVLSDRKINFGESVTLCAPPVPANAIYRWTGPAPISQPDSTCITVTPTAVGVNIYTLNIISTIDSVGCRVACPVRVVVNSLPVICNIVPVLPDRAAICGDTLSFCAMLKATPPPGASVTYQWTITGGQIITSSTGPCVTVKAGNNASEFHLTLLIRINGVDADECDITIPIGMPKCVINAADPSRVLACGDTASFCASVIPGGGTITYSWTVTGGFIETSPTAQCVRVRAGTGTQFSIHVEIRRNNCPTSCDATIPLVPVVCEIVPFDPARSLACGDTVTYCANITPAGGIRTYQWTVTNGTIQTSPNASCIRVKLGAVGDVTIHLEATRNGCATTCSKIVSSSGLKCDVSAFAPGRTLVCGDTATFCATISPSGPNTTYQWTIVGGTIDGSSAGSCVRVIAGSGTEFTITVSVQRNGYCPTTCGRVVALGPISCEVTQLDLTRALACGDTATFCGSILPAGGTRTYQWTVQGGTLLTAATASCVRVKLGSDGLMTLTLNSTRNGCALTCSKTISTSPLKCDIVAFNPNRALACGDTASYCAVIEPAGPNTTYTWTVTGGFIETSPSAQCIRVKAGDPGSFTITVTARRNLYCPTTCSLTVPVSHLKCEIVPLDPGRVFACGDTATFCVNVYPPGVGTSFTWTISGGVILTPSTAQCVRVRFGTTGTFTLFVDISRGGKCISSCDRTFPISPLECEIRRVDSGALACGDTASFCVNANATGVTYEWTVINGTPVTSTTAQCIQVRATGGAELIVRATVRRDGCSATCEFRVPTVGPFCSITGEPSLCAGDSATYCTPFVPGATYSWTISGNGTLFAPTTASCVTARAGTGTGATFRLIVRVTQGTCAVSCTTDVQVRQPPTPPGGCDKCVVTYPDETHLPQSHGTIDADMVMKTFDPKTGAGLPCVVTDTLLRVFYSSDRVMLLGYRQVQVKTSSGTTTRDFPISFVPTTPTCIREPLLGDTISTGDQRYGDWYERPVFPALWITDITGSPTSRAGDFRIGLIESLPDTGVIAPDKVCGLWKYAVRFYDKTRSGGPRATTISDLPDPAKNFWNLGSGADTPSEGFANVPNGGYGAEAAWNLTNRGLLPGHTYRLFFSVYEGGENPHPNYGCVNITIPGGGGGDCPPVAPTLLAGGDGELQKPSNPQLGPKPGVDEFAGTVKQFELRQNQPNPFDHETTIHFAVPERSYVSIRVYTVSGQEVALLAGRMMEAGRQAVTWMPIDRTGRPLAPGVYMYRMTAASRSGVHTVTKKMVLMK